MAHCEAPAKYIVRNFSKFHWTARGIPIPMYIPDEHPLLDRMRRHFTHNPEDRE